MQKIAILDLFKHEHIVKILFFILTFLLTFRLFHFVHIHTTNVLFMDQWDTYRGLFENFNLWEAFRLQHGSHRQGLGAWFSYGLAHLTGLSSFAEAYAMVALSTINTLLAGILLKKIVGRWQSLILLVPFLFLNISQYEVYVGAPNPAHGLIPQTLALLIGLCFWFRKFSLTVFFQIILLFFIMHTGYGYFLVFFALAFAFAQLLFNIRNKTQLFASSTFLVAIAAIIAIFFFNYSTPMTTEEKESLGAHYLWKLPLFATGLFARGLGASRINFLMLPAALTLIGLSIFALRDYFKLAFSKTGLLREQKSLLMLAGCCLLFTLGASFGRTPSGLGASISSRYVPFITLGLLAFTGYLALTNRLWAKRSLFIFAIFFITQELRPRGRDLRFAQTYHLGKLAFENCYLETKDFHVCNTKTDFFIYPPKIAERIPPRLKFLEDRKWSFFKEKK